MELEEFPSLLSHLSPPALITSLLFSLCVFLLGMILKYNHPPEGPLYWALSIVLD